MKFIYKFVFVYASVCTFGTAGTLL